MNDDTIRIKDMEGNAAQLTDFCKNTDFNLNAYLNVKPTKKRVPLWILLVIIGLFLATSCTLWILPVSTVIFKILVLTTLLLMGGILVMMHHNYENWPLTGITGVTMLCVVLISLNIYSPEQVLKKVEEQTVNKVKG